MNVGSLFSGIGGFDLGLERAGMRVVWQCESDDFCRRVLAKHWPDVPCYQDVRELRGTGREAIPPVDVLCGGFPCQDISSAAGTERLGIHGARSGLWSEYARLIGDLRPRYVVVENVSALLARGLNVVLGDLAALGYDAEWDCLPASAFGAPHQRDRIWLVGYPHDQGQPVVAVDDEASRLPRMGDTDGVAGTQELARERGPEALARSCTIERVVGSGSGDSDANGESALGAPVAWAECDHWGAEPDVGRVADGVPMRLDRLRSLGNALVPQIAEWIGRRIMSYEASR